MVRTEVISPGAFDSEHTLYLWDVSSGIWNVFSVIWNASSVNTIHVPVKRRIGMCVV